jgi:hypothetical protein
MPCFAIGDSEIVPNDARSRTILENSAIFITFANVCSYSVRAKLWPEERGCITVVLPLDFVEAITHGFEEVLVGSDSTRVCACHQAPKTTAEGWRVLAIR